MSCGEQSEYVVVQCSNPLEQTVPVPIAEAVNTVVTLTSLRGDEMKLKWIMLLKNLKSAIKSSHLFKLSSLQKRTALTLSNTLQSLTSAHPSLIKAQSPAGQIQLKRNPPTCPATHTYSRIVSCNMKMVVMPLYKQGFWSPMLFFRAFSHDSGLLMSIYKSDRTSSQTAARFKAHLCRRYERCSSPMTSIMRSQSTSEVVRLNAVEFRSLDVGRSM